MNRRVMISFTGEITEGQNCHWKNETDRFFKVNYGLTKAKRHL